MSGNASRKHKQHMLMQKSRKLFGNISARDESGKLDLVLFGASQGRVIISKSKYEQGGVPIKNNKRNLKAL